MSFFESETWQMGKKLVEEYLKKGVFEKSDGAVVFRGEKYGLHTRVFITSGGLPTYEAKDLGLAQVKLEKYSFDTSITITAVEQAEYFKVVQKAIEFIFPELVEKIKHVSHGMLRLSTGKMSSRTGDIIVAESILNEVQEKVLEKMEEANTEGKDKIADQIAVGAVKYSILKQAPGNDIIFNFEKSLSFEGDSGPYLQYTYARTQSILNKAEDVNISASTEKMPEMITNVERLLHQFPEVVELSLYKYEPHYITTYLIQLASAFNNFYAKKRIVDSGENAPYRLALTSATAIILKNGLHLLGIEAPEKM